MLRREHSLLIEKTARAVGGEQRLCALLGVSWDELHAWIDARAAMPESVFLRLVDLLEDTPTPVASQPPPHPFLEVGYTPRSRIELLENALDAALAMGGTDLGNLQLVDPEGTRRPAAWR